MKIVNLTPHPCNFVLPTGENIEVAPAGPAPRVSTTEVLLGHTPKGMPIKKIAYGDIVGLPEPAEGTAYLVSQLCCQACPDRKDLFFPADLKRDEQGRIIGCAALGQI